MSKQILTPSVMNELREFYNISNQEEKNKFAEILSSALKEEERKNQEEDVQKNYEREEEATKKIKSIAYRDPLKIQASNKQEDISIEDIDKAENNRHEKIDTKISKESRKKIYGHLSDFEITHLAHKGMINPFINYEYKGKKEDTKIPYGLCGYGYKIRATQAYLPLTSATESTLDPKNHSIYSISQPKKGKIYLAPGEVILCVSVETFNIPEGIIITTEQLSNYLHCGITVKNAPITSNFNGSLAMLIKNENVDKHVVIYPNEGILELRFIRPFSLTRKMFEKMYGSKKT